MDFWACIRCWERGAVRHRAGHDVVDVLPGPAASEVTLGSVEKPAIGAAGLTPHEPESARRSAWPHHSRHALPPVKLLENGLRAGMQTGVPETPNSALTCGATGRSQMASQGCVWSAVDRCHGPAATSSDWGDNSNGQSTLPPEVPDVAAFAADRHPQPGAET